jgi:phosphoribosylanthranilate isomerase
MGDAVRTRVKFCGITRKRDALIAARLGVDALGFNFWKGSKRYLAPAQAGEIIAALPAEVTAVAVFVNASAEEIRRALATSGATVAQLHGDETPAFCAALGVPAVKAVPATRLEVRYPVAAMIVDAPVAGYGGGGRTFRWEALQGRHFEAPVLVAGGLTPENVARCVRMLRPWGVDVASGVESAPGEKDPGKMAAFMRAVRGG